MKARGIIGTAALFLLLGITAPARTQQAKSKDDPARVDRQTEGQGQAKAKKQQDKGQRQAPPAKSEQQQPGARQSDRPGKQQQADQPRADKQKADRQRQDAQQQRVDKQQQQALANQRQANQRRQEAQLQANQHQALANQRQANQRRQEAQLQADQHQALANQRQANQQRQQARLSQERQRQLIAEQQRRVDVYRRDLDQQHLRAQHHGAQLQQQKRVANYRYYQAYLARMRQQQLALQRSYDYDNDPYFYTASSYRYSRGGSYYETNEYGANVLRQAINNGYAEGYGAGQADRQDRWASDYQNSYAYQDANYGYSGYYVNQAEYNYYFREGFNRGYQDGYDSRMQYGSYSNGSGSILGAILSEILDLQSMR